MDVGRLCPDSPAKTDYIRAYYAAIRDGSVTVGKWVTLLYERIVQGLEEGEYTLDSDKAESVIEWIQEHCFHTEGPLAPQPIKLELWQKAFISCLYGICEPGTGKPQFREAVLVIGRKNGKTLFGASLVKYTLYNAGFGTRVYCTAPKLDQASLIYDSVWNMIQLDPEWQDEEADIRASIQGHNRKAIDDSHHAKKRTSDISIPGLNSVFKKQSFNERKSDGFNPNLVCCDEIASWSGDKGLKQYEVWKSAMGAREMGDNPPILLSCTTSGYINDSIYDEIIKRSTSFLLGTSEESRLLPMLYMIDDIDKWDDIEELRKANPNLGISISESYLKEEIAVAHGSISKRAEFICKYGCLKQNSTQAWLPYETVDACFSEKPLDLESFRGSYCVGGLDLSQSVDLTSCCVVIEKEGKLYAFSHFFMPRERLETAIAEDGVPYNAYLEQGFLTLSGDNYVDYHDCFNWFVNLMEQYELYILQIGYDRFSAQYLVQDLTMYGFHCDDVYQGFNLTPVIREVEGTIKDGNVYCGNNNLLKVHFLNSAIKSDSETQKVKLVKLGTRTRIDGMAALLDAFCVRQAHYSEIGEQLKNE